MRSRRMKWLSVGVMVLAPFFALAVSSSAFADGYAFTTIDVPGANITEAHGINNVGQILGQYTDTVVHGFVDTGGVLTTLDVPGANGTAAFGINDAGQVVGYYGSFTPPPPLPNFLYTSGVYTTIIDVPPGAIGTQVQGINNTGQIVGYFNDGTGTHGFLNTGGVFTTLDAPDATSGNTAARGINNLGQIVGTFNSPGPGALGFLYSSGVYTTITVPGASETFAYGINDLGQIVGTFVDGTGAHGFLYTGGVFTTLDVPGAFHTESLGINNAGQIVGWYVVSVGQHGYLATPVNASPVCSAAQAVPSALWPPNHKFVPIVVMGVTDPDGDSVTVTVTSVTQDEPVNSMFDGNTSPDAVIQAGAASVRAERSGESNGRVYQISFTAQDGKGGSCTGAVSVGVPHSQGEGVTAIDNGQLYDSTIP